MEVIKRVLKHLNLAKYYEAPSQGHPNGTPTRDYLVLEDDIDLVKCSLALYKIEYSLSTPLNGHCRLRIQGVKS